MIIDCPRFLKFYTVRMQKMGKKGILDSRYLGSPETLGLGQKSRRRLTGKDDIEEESGVTIVSPEARNGLEVRRVPATSLISGDFPTSEGYSHDRNLDSGSSRLQHIIQLAQAELSSLQMDGKRV